MVTSIAIGVLVSMNIGFSADLVWNLDLNLVANLSGDLSGVLVGNLVALLLDILLAVRSRGVASVSWLGLSLAITIRTSMADNLGVVTDNLGTLVHLGVGLTAVLCHDILALLGVGGVHDHVVLLVTHLVVLDVVLGVAVLLLVAVLVMSTTRGSNGAGGHT